MACPSRKLGGLMLSLALPDGFSLQQNEHTMNGVALLLKTQGTLQAVMQSLS